MHDTVPKLLRIRLLAPRGPTEDGFEGEQRWWEDFETTVTCLSLRHCNWLYCRDRELRKQQRVPGSQAFLLAAMQMMVMMVMIDAD